MNDGCLASSRSNETIRGPHYLVVERRLATGTAGIDLDLVCDRGDGGMLGPDLMTKAFKRLAAQAGLSPKTRLPICATR